jgi:hypothetical protein
MEKIRIWEKHPGSATLYNYKLMYASATLYSRRSLDIERILNISNLILSVHGCLDRPLCLRRPVRQQLITEDDVTSRSTHREWWMDGTKYRQT